MNWKTKVSREEFAWEEGGRVALEIEELESLEETIDELFVELERTGNPALLEELCPYFGCVWPAARGLTEYLLKHSPERDGAVQILEVGCGLAIPSLALARTVRFSRVVATDFHPEVPAFLERNLARNPVPNGRFEYRRFDWKHPGAELGRFGVVIGSDILYEKNHPAEVADALIRLVKSGGRIVVADPGRPYLQTFVDEMRARGYGADPILVPVVDKKDVLVFDFRKLSALPQPP
ncbi:MAG: methyltransferase domain-containing protein [Bdellovibrionales bacterium]|nr:methyltransferase domain-containing protein [Bdellovibrionales bacterium]